MKPTGFSERKLPLGRPEFLPSARPKYSSVSCLRSTKGPPCRATPLMIRTSSASASPPLCSSAWTACELGTPPIAGVPPRGRRPCVPREGTGWTSRSRWPACWTRGSSGSNATPPRPVCARLLQEWPSLACVGCCGGPESAAIPCGTPYGPPRAARSRRAPSRWATPRPPTIVPRGMAHSMTASAGAPAPGVRGRSARLALAPSVP